MNPSDPFSGMTAFIKAAESSSFSQAARLLGLTPSAVSKTVSRMEMELGVKLFHRSPRIVTLTSEGELFYQRCKDLLSTVEDARAVLQGKQPNTPTQLKVCLPVSFAQQKVAPKLAAWQQKHPNVHLQIWLSDRHVDLVHERFDLAVRFDELQDSRLIAKKLPAQILITCASPDYLDQQGIPTTPSDLDGHNCLGFLDKQSNLPRPWEFRHAQHNFLMKPSGNLVCDQGTFLLNAAIAGAGIIQAPDYLVKDALAKGQLQQILVNYHYKRDQWWLVYPYTRQPSAKLQAFVEFLQSL